VDGTVHAIDAAVVRLSRYEPAGLERKKVMSKVARKLLTPAVAGIVVGLLAQQASASEEMVVYGSARTYAVKVDPQVFRTEIDSYIRALNAELKATLGRDQKPGEARKVLASNVTPGRG
jgi:hypothetical protein